MWLVSVAYGVRFFFHFQCFLTVIHSLVDGAADAELARLRFFVCGVSDGSAVVLQYGGQEQTVRLECAASMWSRFTYNCCDA